MTNIFSLRLFKYILIFLIITFASNYCSSIFKRNIADNQFEGAINFGGFQLDKSQICMIIIGLLATQIYNIFNLENVFDKIFNKSNRKN
tara:strand:+ start:496 stop:762 length:267 start_codon:yes stop_codon:yes gene_type:complete